MMRTRYLCLTLVALASLSGCNFPAGVAAPADLPPTPFAAPPTFQPSSTPAPEQPTLVPTAAPPTPTTQPTETPLVSLTELLVSPLAGEVICRFGPGNEYSVEAKISPGVQVTASGRNAQGTWLHVDNPARAGKLCWAPRVELAGAEAAEALPVLPPPNNIVTKVNVELDPTKEDIPCAELPFKYTATFTITTTGPVTVKYEADSSKGQVIDPTTYAFSASGTKTFTEKFKVDAAGDHWFQVDVLSPNAVSGKGKAKLTCTP
jgi:hypothetical protein